MKLYTRKSLIKSMAWINLKQFRAFSLCLTVLLLAACSSEPLLDIVNPSTTNADSSYATATFGLTDISTFDVVVDDGIVHLLVGGKTSAKDKQATIRYVRSEDGGIHWTNPVALSNFPGTIAIRGNDIQLAAKGDHLLAVWQRKGELPGMGPMVSAYSEDGGKTWKQGNNPAINNAGDQSHLDLIADQDGHFHAVWLEDPEENGYQSLRYAQSVDGGKSWGKAAKLDDSTCSCCWNTFALAPNGELNILYRDMKPRDMALQQSSDNGKTWRRTSTVGEFNWQFDGCPHVGGGLAAFTRRWAMPLAQPCLDGGRAKSRIILSGFRQQRQKLVSAKNNRQYRHPRRYCGL